MPVGRRLGISYKCAWFLTHHIRALLGEDNEQPAYRRIGRRFPAHLRINHSAGERLRRDPLAITCAHTNTVEAFNATIKRATIGVWHRFSVQHSDRYLRELSTRWKLREASSLERFESVFGTMLAIPLGHGEEHRNLLQFRSKTRRERVEQDAALPPPVPLGEPRILKRHGANALY